MPGTPHISYLKSNEIDRVKWDRCITLAENGLVYSYSFYLDHMAAHWDALVLNDYEAVMPLPWKRKWKIDYLYQPFLTAQLGVTGKEVTRKVLRDFLHAIPTRFKLWEFPLNHGNIFTVQEFDLFERKNFVLDLRPPYPSLFERYRESTKRNIKKSKQYGCHLNKDVSIRDVIKLNDRNTHTGSPGELDQFEALYAELKERGQAKIYGMNSDREELLSCCVFFFSHNRAYYILVGNHPNGRTLGTSHALLDAFIIDHAGQNLLLDFEGSDIESLAFFYSSFGAVEEKYTAVKKNELPWYVRWLKT